jgi:hypothetical protein
MYSVTQTRLCYELLCLKVGIAHRLLAQRLPCMVWGTRRNTVLDGLVSAGLYFGPGWLKIVNAMQILWSHVEF